MTEIRKEVMAVIVTYHPDKTFNDRLVALLNEFREIFIVDNGTCDELKAVLGDLIHDKRVRVTCNQENLGIAAALNQGIRLARNKGYQWLATFDQDSKIGPGFCGKMFEALHAYIQKERVAIISPVYRDEKTDDEMHVEIAPRPFTTLTSGNFVNLNIFDKIGLFYDEGFFIDYVDHELCLRCVRAGYHVIRAKHATLKHRLGFTTQHSLLGRLVGTTNHNPVRRYYITRNRAVMWKKYFCVFPQWVINDIFMFFKESIKMGFFEREKYKKFSAVLLGLFHAALGVDGKLTSHWLKRLSGSHDGAVS